MNGRAALSSFLILVLGSAANAMTFGSRGMDGQDGYNGYSGKSGRDMTVVADGSAQNYQLGGLDGEDGRDGYRGGDAMGCSHPWNPSYNLEGADGGRAGRGGNGGNGGSGGDITVHFEHADNLKKIYVYSVPGEGGRAGRGSQGGRACYCSNTQWTVTNGTSSQTYYCQNGQDGQWSYDGTQGSRGSYGAVTIISQLDPVAPSKPQATIAMADMEKAPIDLSTNNWENRKGARALFVVGSDISDSYRYYAGRTEVRYALSWKANRPLSDFGTRKMTLELKDGKVSKFFPTDVWVKGDETAEHNGKLYTISNALFTNQIFNISIPAFVGTGTNLVVQVKDTGNVSDQVSTTFTIEYLTVQNGYWYKRFSGAVDPKLVTATPAGLSIAVGQLPISDVKYFAAGVRAFVRLYAKRSLGNYYATKEITRDQTLKD